MNFNRLLRNPDKDRRKVVNSVDVIRHARDLGSTLDNIGKLCDVSKTMVSHWGNPNRNEQPTYEQLQPLLTKYGKGRFRVKLEPLSPAAIEPKKSHQLVVTILFSMLMLAMVCLGMVKPCVNEWEECRLLAWYKMPLYQMIKNSEALEEFKAFRRIKGTGSTRGAGMPKSYSEEQSE